LRRAVTQQFAGDEHLNAALQQSGKTNPSAGFNQSSKPLIYGHIEQPYGTNFYF
jgi:hypothetical protein